MAFCGCSLRGFTQFLCLLALAACGYALWVEMALEQDPEYEPLCNLSEESKCSRVLMSEWGKGFGIVQMFVDEPHWLIQPNPIYGFFTYSLLFLCAFSTGSKLVSRLQLSVCLLCNAGSAYLGYVLFFVLKDFCVVCVTTYVLNFLLLVCSFFKNRNIRTVRQHDSFHAGKSTSNFRLPTMSGPNDFKKNI